jgi:response regulator RpfG family c-di-GMP phosphodiesterase
VKLSDLDILYIEEDNETSHQVIALLSPICHHLIHATSSEEALVALKKKIPALVICATSLPNTDIINLCNTFKSYSATLKILLHMGMSESAIFYETIPLEIDGYVAKPLNPDAFLHAVEKIARAFVLNDSKNEALHLANQLANTFEVSAIVSKTNPKGIITYANKSFEAISGRFSSTNIFS